MKPKPILKQWLLSPWVDAHSQWCWGWSVRAQIGLMRSRNTKTRFRCEVLTHCCPGELDEGCISEHWNLAGVNVIKSCKFTDVELFTGLDCSCFRHIYYISLLVDVSSFPAEKIREKETRSAAQLHRKSRLQRGLLICHCATAAASSDVSLVVSGRTGRAPGQGLPVRDITGWTRMLLRAIAERKSKESCWVLWVRVAARRLAGSSPLVCISQTLPIHPICWFIELHHFSSAWGWFLLEIRLRCPIW